MDGSLRSFCMRGECGQFAEVQVESVWRTCDIPGTELQVFAPKLYPQVTDAHDACRHRIDISIFSESILKFDAHKPSIKQPAVSVRPAKSCSQYDIRMSTGNGGLQKYLCLLARQREFRGIDRSWRHPRMSRNMESLYKMPGCTDQSPPRGKRYHKCFRAHTLSAAFALATKHPCGRVPSPL